MRSVTQALAEVMQRVHGGRGVERVGLADAEGRVTANDIHARADSPAFDNSAMDGYAVCAGDVQQDGVELPVVAESRAGGPPPAPIERGAAARIFTGAPLPPGCDAVIIQEDSEVTDRGVRFATRARCGDHVRAAGSDLRAGELAIPAGTAVGPGEVALLASQDMPSCDVRPRPTVAILSSGDELRDIGEPPRPGSIVNSNAYMLAALVRGAGGRPTVLPPMPDALAEATERVREGLAADVLVCSGGVSVGDYDVVPQALEALGAETHFHKVRMKPGKPLTFASVGETPVFGLPGNPVSAFVGFYLFVRPALRRMVGDPRPYPARVPVALETPLNRKAGRTELLRVRLVPGREGWTARPVSRQGSGALPALVGVDALLVLPAERGHFEAGERLDALLLSGPGSEVAPFDPVD